MNTTQINLGSSDNHNRAALGANGAILLDAADPVATGEFSAIIVDGSGTANVTFDCSITGQTFNWLFDPSSSWVGPVTNVNKTAGTGVVALKKL